MEPSFKPKAIALRRQGLSYSEILKEVPVAKSTLALWLHSVGLSKKQKQRLTEKKLAAALRGGARKKEIRLEVVKRIHEDAAKDIVTISAREFFLLGVALYWCEGSKEKDFHPGSSLIFTNSDPKMIFAFVKWLLEICRVAVSDIYPELYIHERAIHSVQEAIYFWSLQTGLHKSCFSRVYFKKNKINTKRRNVGEKYYGLLRIRVLRSSSLNRKIAGWINAITRCII